MFAVYIVRLDVVAPPDKFDETRSSLTESKFGVEDPDHLENTIEVEVVTTAKVPSEAYRCAANAIEAILEVDNIQPEGIEKTGITKTR